MNFNLVDTDFNGLKIVEYKKFDDNRGFFQELCKTSSLWKWVLIMILFKIIFHHLKLM